MQKPKLLFVGAFPPVGRNVFGGNVTDCKTLLASSFPNRVEVVLLDTTQRSVPPPPFHRRAVDAFARVFEFSRLLRAERPAVTLLFASSGFSFFEKGLLAALARAHGVSSILAVRSGAFADTCRRSRTFRWLAAPLLAVPTFVICQGESWQRFYNECFDLPASRCPVIDSWVATPELLEVGRQREYRREATLKLLFVGWVEAAKGVFELLAAVRQLVVVERRANVSLTIAGDGGAMEAASAWVREQGMDQHVTFAGWVDGDAKLALFRDADAFVLPSHTEGLPNAMLEAMAAGLPPVVTPVGSIPDVIHQGSNGLIVPRRDVAALAEALRTLVDTDGLRERLGRAAFAMASDRFAVERAAASLAQLVERAGRNRSDESE